MCRGVLLPHGWCFPRLYPSQPQSPGSLLREERGDRNGEGAFVLRTQNRSCHSPKC